ncbi:MAG: beta-ketoacyl-ACP synthase I [Proteobacteria bacterium]|nr:beta-ketoacyl-ACP synthase I [Pseudomonadota bacterium]
MRRVVVSGVGVLSSIGIGKEEVTRSLRNMASGISANATYQEMGMRSRVSGEIDIDLAENINRKHYRFMADAAAFSYLAMQEAIEDAGLEPEQIKDSAVGLITGSGGGSTGNVVEAADILRDRGVRRVGPYRVPRTMCSTTSAVLSTLFGVMGTSYSISSACATSAHCIGHAADLIRNGSHHTVFAGGGEEVHWTQSVLFDAMGAMSSKYNDTPEHSSRPYDANRDGFVISGGGGILVLEDMEHAEKRGAKIICELVGYGATSDGYDMVAPSGEGAERCMRQALATVDSPIDYINTHGTATVVGDVTELASLNSVFEDKVPPISATKSLTGHALGAAGVNEAIYSMMMMRDGFIAGSANIFDLDPAAEGFDIVTQTRDAAINTIMSNSFGFGGTNATLVFAKV